MVGLWLALQYGGVNLAVAPFLGAAVGFPLAFHRLMTPKAPLSGGMLLGVATSIGALILMTVTTIVGGGMVVGLLGRIEDDRVVLLYYVILFCVLALLLALQLAAPALSFHDRRLRGLKAWRMSLGRFGSFLLAATLLLLSLFGLAVAAMVLSVLTTTPPSAGWLGKAGEALALSVAGAFAVTVTAGAMTGMVAQSLVETPDGLAGVFD